MSKYVVQQPHSNTNPTDKYRVVKYSDWHNAMYGDGKSIIPVSVFDTYKEAQEDSYHRNTE